MMNIVCLRCVIAAEPLGWPSRLARLPPQDYGGPTIKVVYLSHHT
jgi:hypothetical protein